MGLMGRRLGMVFGSGRNVLVETAQVFRENAEAAGQRDADARGTAMQQLAAEFAAPRHGLFDRFIDGLNRLPRPFLAFGTLGLFAAAMVDPIWFASRMQGLALVPEPLWWLMGAIVSFYFGARYQAHGQAFQRSIATTMAQVPQVAENLRALDDLRDTHAETPGTAMTGTDARLAEAAVQAAVGPEQNAALEAWKRRQA